ncbi:flagellar motor protein MotB [Clostridium sp. cel8]|uniref:OmpA/MotB family protein n=1 Tax=Clostridium sp. cel8 TaxID=2663123 RepID=UPI0015F6384A|nr:flagellar motor protein MotB [Clostridium sp. cel8]MBA5851405.1 flagellar motor protein MotB [Clostridium sp. cel8]
MKRKRREKKPDGLRWMLTYSDLITLLMIFFIVMYSMGQVDQNKYRQIAESFSIAMGGGKSIIGSDSKPSVKDSVKQIDTLNVSQVEKNKLDKLQQQVNKYLKQNKLSGSVSTNIDERGLVVSINDTLFFDTGKAEIKPEIKTKLKEIGKIINELGNSIRVEGHTDNVPISNNKYSSNWQLSAIRAANVVQFLQDEVGVKPEKLSVGGYGEYKPVAANSTDVGRAKNRRVDIIILSTKFDEMEHNENTKDTNVSQNNSKTSK